MLHAWITSITPVSVDKAHCGRESECTRQAVLDKLLHARKLPHSSVTVCIKLHRAPYQWLCQVTAILGLQICKPRMSGQGSNFAITSLTQLCVASLLHHTYR